MKQWRAVDCSGSQWGGLNSGGGPAGWRGLAGWRQMICGGDGRMRV